MDRDGSLQDAYHKLAFYASCVRQEIRSGGEAIKALEILEREVNKAIAVLSSPCACGGKKPLAVVNGRVGATAFADWRRGYDLTIRHREMAGKDRGIRAIFFEGKP